MRRLKRRTQAYFSHLLQGNFLSQALLSLLHSTQLCCGLGERGCTGDVVGDDDVADISLCNCFVGKALLTNAVVIIRHGTSTDRGLSSIGHGETESQHLVKYGCSSEGTLRRSRSLSCCRIVHLKLLEPCYLCREQ